MFRMCLNSRTGTGGRGTGRRIKGVCHGTNSSLTTEKKIVLKGVLCGRDERCYSYLQSKL